MEYILKSFLSNEISRTSNLSMSLTCEIEKQPLPGADGVAKFDPEKY